MVLQVVPSLLLLAAFGGPVDGHGSGTLPVPGHPLRLVFHLKGTGGTVDSPDQKSMGIPVTHVTSSGAGVVISVASIQGVYTGKLTKSGNEMAGEWKQGATIPLTVKRPT